MNNSANILSFILLFIIPGFVSLKSYDLLKGNDDRNLSASIVEYVAFNTANLLLFFWIIPRLDANDTRVHNFLLYTVGIFLVSFFFPIVEGWLAYQASKTKLMRKRFHQFQENAWDKVFLGHEDYWIVFHLKSGEQIGGKFGEKSRATIDPESHTIYVEEVWYVDEETQEFIKPKNRTAGAYINADDCHYVEMFSD